MVKLGDPHPQGPLAIAQSLAEAGLQVLPARHKEKAPLVKWTEYQTIRTENMLAAWFGGGTPRNYWVMTGRISGYVVIDCDSREGETWWREFLGADVFDETARVKTAKGHHYWFAIPADHDEEQMIPSWSVHEDEGISFDFRADGTGVIVPPSIHESGVAYAWEIPLEESVVAPPAILDGTARSAAPTGPASVTAGPTGNTRSMLGQLLGNPPGGEGSGRNDWLARVAGHYAKQYHNLEDLYKVHTAQANLLMGTPLDEDEFNKTIESVWRGEHERNPHRALDDTCGWLQSAGTRIVTQVLIKGPNDTKDYDLAEWANFDVQAKGVMLDDDERRTYWVQIHRRRPGHSDVDVIDAVIPAATFGDDKKLRSWFAAYGCSILPPENMWPRIGSAGVRLARYLESQSPPQVVVTDALGWDQTILDGNGGFVTHDGIITAEEVFESNAIGVRPYPRLKSGGLAPHHYGFSKDLAEARRVLDEVLSFQAKDVTSVFGAWWAACLLKSQILVESSIFPVMAIEAPSESGKTNGFFEMMTQLNGNTRGEMVPTRAALRDMLAAHNNGITWVDDLDDPAYLMELVRAVTSGGSVSKMGEDKESIKNATLTSPLVISGEALGMGNQKALLDRAIVLKVGSPTKRRSRHNPDRPQWDDVLDLRRQYPSGLADLAGHFVQQALRRVDQTLDALRAGRNGQGRAGDKVAVLRAGARLLDALLSESPEEESQAWQGTSPHATRTEEWIGDNKQEKSAENSLTLEIAPWALRRFRYPDAPRAAEGVENTDTPIWIEDKRVDQATLQDDDDYTVWVNAAMLADAWQRDKGRVEVRTHTTSALRDQLDALKAPSRQFRIVNGGTRRAYYRAIRGELALSIYHRAQDR